MSVRQVVGRAKKRQLATLAVNTHKCNTTGTACIHAPTNTVKLACTILQCKKAALCHIAIIATRQIHSIALPTFLFSTLHCLENTKKYHRATKAVVEGKVSQNQQTKKALLQCIFAYCSRSIEPFQVRGWGLVEKVVVLYLGYNWVGCCQPAFTLGGHLKLTPND